LEGGNNSFDNVSAIPISIFNGLFIKRLVNESAYFSLFFSKKATKKSAKSLGRPPSVS